MGKNSNDDILSILEKNDFLADAELKISQAEEELANNKGLDANESLKRLKEKYNL